MGRVIHTNLHAKFNCDVLKVCTPPSSLSLPSFINFFFFLGGCDQEPLAGPAFRCRGKHLSCRVPVWKEEDTFSYCRIIFVMYSTHPQSEQSFKNASSAWIYFFITHFSNTVDILFFNCANTKGDIIKWNGSEPRSRAERFTGDELSVTCLFFFPHFIHPFLKKENRVGSVPLERWTKLGNSLRKVWLRCCVEIAFFLHQQSRSYEKKRGRIAGKEDVIFSNQHF